MSRYENAREHILEKLRRELPQHLTYHSIHHVLDVLNAVEMLCESEKVSEEELEFLRIAALYHDSGFIVNAVNHEKLSCNFAREYLPQFGYNSNEITKICEIIMATKVPQMPINHLQQIICDADLDYLGRDDFYTIGNKIFNEMLTNGTVSNQQDWNKLQVSFLSAHNYFTDTSKRIRKPVKEKHLKEVMQMVGAPGSL
jgi:uncharacterized protein